MSLKHIYIHLYTYFKLEDKFKVLHIAYPVLHLPLNFVFSRDANHQVESDAESTASSIVCFCFVVSADHFLVIVNLWLYLFVINSLSINNCTIIYEGRSQSL